MTRQEALDYDNELKNKMTQEATMLGLEGNTGSSIVDNYIMVIPDDARKGMIFLRDEAVSYKFGNIRMDLKKAIVAGLELMASVSCPESLFNYVQLLVVGALFIQKVTQQNIGKIEAHIVYYLHIRNGYEIGIERESFIDDLFKWNKAKNENILNPVEIENAIKNLYKWKVIDIVDGKIWLKEIVVGITE